MPDVLEVPLKPRVRRSPARLLLFAAVLAMAGCGTRPEPVTSVTIVADPGRFGTIERAAAAEDSIDWWAHGDTPSPDDTTVVTSPEDAKRLLALETKRHEPILAASRDRATCTASFAALELARFLPGAFGIPKDSVRVVTPSGAPPEGDLILVGNASGVARVDMEYGKYHFWSGRDRERRLIVIDTPEGESSTLTGAYMLLEQLGVRFYDLGDSNVVMPKRPAGWPRKLQWVEPAYQTRGFWAWEPRGSTDFFLCMARNRMNLWTAAEPRAAFLEKLGIRLTAGGHGIESEFLDPNGRSPGESRTRFQLHPEWYGLENGRRTPGISGESGLNFCTSNHAAIAELARGIDESLRNGSMRHADVVELWPLDGGRWCQCDSCKAIGSPQDRWLRVAAEVRRQLRRPVTIVTPAYLETSTAPTQPVADASARPDDIVTFFPYFRCYAHALADPACEIVNAPIESRLRGWTTGPSRPYKGEMAIGEYYNVSWTKSLPFVHPHVMAADLRDWSEHGIRHFTTMHVPTRLWGTWTFEHAMLARLLWNPRANVDSLIGDFCAREYGDAGDDLRAFYHALELATANLTDLQYSVGSIGFGESPRLLDRNTPIFRLRHLTDEPPPGVADSGTTLTGIGTSLDAARAALDAGRGRNHDPRVAARLAEVDARFRYGDAMLRFWIALIRAAEALRERRAPDLHAQIAIADSQAVRLRAVTDLVQVAATHANAADGLAASGATKVYARLREIEATAPR